MEPRLEAQGIQMSVPATWNEAQLPQWILIKTQPKNSDPPKPENPLPNTLKLEEGLKFEIKTVEVKLVQNI